MLLTALNTVSTDDAYVNGHVTFVAPRVAGQVMDVFVDDNYRVKKGDLLVQLDKEPYQVQLAIKQSAVTAADSDLEAAKAQVQALVAQTRANKFKLDHAIEDVDNQIASLRANVAILSSKNASLDLAKANLKRGEEPTLDLNAEPAKPQEQSSNGQPVSRRCPGGTRSRRVMRTQCSTGGLAHRQARPVPYPRGLQILLMDAVAGSQCRACGRKL